MILFDIYDFRHRGKLNISSIYADIRIMTLCSTAWHVRDVCQIHIHIRGWRRAGGSLTITFSAYTFMAIMIVMFSTLMGNLHLIRLPIWYINVILVAYQILPSITHSICWGFIRMDILY